METSVMNRTPLSLGREWVSGSGIRTHHRTPTGHRTGQPSCVNTTPNRTRARGAEPDTRHARELDSVQRFGRIECDRQPTATELIILRESGRAAAVRPAEGASPTARAHLFERLATWLADVTAEAATGSERACPTQPITPTVV